ncbi:MAG: histone family protein [Candidatus Aenigmarchaeota archaeon]|nr:histone family protein [Candidatus Aenigmarchaeota archaeon]
MSGLPRAPVERLLKEATGKRVSRTATEQMAVVLEEMIAEVAKDASVFCKHAGRKTITYDDIVLATKGKKK